VGRGDDPLDDSDDQLCTYPDEPVVITDPVTEPEQTPLPVWARFHWEGVVNGSRFEDSDLGSAEFRIELLDSTATVPVCTITYDLSRTEAPTTSHPWVTEGGGDHWQPMELQVSSGQGNSTCLGYDGQDLRDVLAGIPWGLAHGPLDTLANELEQDVIDDGGNWAADWEPYVMGAFLRLEDDLLLEVGYAFSYDADCDVVDDPTTATPLAVPADALGDRYVVATGTELFTVPELRNFAELATIEAYFPPVCLTTVPLTPTAGDGSCDSPIELDLTLESIGSTFTVETDDLGGDEALSASACTDGAARDAVFRVLLPPGTGLEASVDYPSPQQRPSLAYVEAGSCDGLVGACAGPDQAQPGVHLVLNEVLADTSNVDANCDGAPSPADQFVEIVNAGSLPVDLADAELLVGGTVKHVFADVLRPGDSLVVFAGGTPTFDGTGPAWCDPLPGSVSVLVADSPLDLQSDGDSVTLRGVDGTLYDLMDYGVEGDDDQSLVRSPELDNESEFVAHNTMGGAIGRVSPGTLADGGQFADLSDCDVVRIDDDDMVSHAPVLVVSEPVDTDENYTLTLRTF